MTRAESKAATRAELLDAARRVFVERGYHGASLDLVAREAGFTKGAVYSAFGSKGAMFLAVYERELERRVAVIEQMRSDEQALRQFFERLRAERDWTVALLEFRLHAARDEDLNRAYGEHHRRFLDAFARITGLARADAVALIALGNGFALEQIALPDEDLEQLFIDVGRSFRKG